MNIDTDPCSERPHPRHVNWTTGIKYLDTIWQLSDQKINIITGDQNSGKQELLLQIAITCVLPRTFGDVFLGGHDTHVAFFDNEFNLSLARLVELLYSRFESIVSIICQDGIDEETLGLLESLDFDKILEICLKRFWILKSRDATQFLISFGALNRRMKTIQKNQYNDDFSYPPSKFFWAIFVDELESFRTSERDNSIAISLKRWISLHPNHLVVSTSSWDYSTGNLILKDNKVHSDSGSISYVVEKEKGFHFQDQNF